MSSTVKRIVAVRLDEVQLKNGVENRDLISRAWVLEFEVMLQIGRKE